MSITVNQLYEDLLGLVPADGLGLLELDGRRHDWTIGRGRIAAADLTTAKARLRVYANCHAA